MAKIKWKAVPGHEGVYEASTDGRVRQLARIIRCGPPSGNGTRLLRARVMRQQTDRNGYRTITLGGRKTAAHRVIALTFLPNPEGLKQVNHRSGVKSDNRVSNLEWCTASYNAWHSHSVLRKNTGNTCWRSKLTDESVMRAKEMRARGMTYREIGESLSVALQTVYHAVSGLSWRHLNGPESRPANSPTPSPSVSA